ncbi:YceI family protein [Gordonia sp. CPCC 205333]|uniref:YceI family protein n=1 Tax=Gordonia sp. CPCC 205333 TaxID=3140790 RepID=UPI003AF371B0
MSEKLTVGPHNGELILRTGVAGPAAKAGHRLTISFESWSGSTTLIGGAPSTVMLSIVVDSLTVLRGEGGVTPLTGAEKVVARSNALKTLQAKKFREIAYVGDSVEPIDGGYLVSGQLAICGRTVDQSIGIDASQADAIWSLSAASVIRHSDVGLKPFSLMMGTLKVADEVELGFRAELSRD